MSDGVLATERTVPPDDDAELTAEAKAVLEANWLGHATSPSRRLYPHQWSWDAACIAIGYAPWNQERAENELRSLFSGQWRDGLLPHIVFTDGARYFPGPDFWQTERSPDAPASPKTSGIVQPPIHATAALHVYRLASDRARATVFLEELLPKLAAWHAYLYRERARTEGGLVEIWHPWESGMDNSPLWDAALERMSFEAEQLPEYERVDVDVAEATERPSDGEYDRYVYLVSVFRELAYDSSRMKRVAPFALQPVLFNSLLVQSNRDLAEIARIVGADPEPFEAWAESTSAALEETLWDDEHAVYVDFDVEAGERVGVRTAAGLAPLYAGVPTRARAERMVEVLADSRVAVGDSGWAVTSLAPEDPRFQATRYWRGPVWPILNWVLQRGLDRYGYPALAADVRSALVELARSSGFYEHYSAVTGRGHGGEQFAWTAALVLDALHEDGLAPEALSRSEIEH
ncbi:MAG: glycoside hydrolase [Actinomycetota bacterium]|nr:glycoside hydrolase [Actinomycetota bacterium]